ncbi:helicase conserved c-terminal domain-containing [Cystoisospora suis]|uniref:RNA helicase n=1 Tax=Cystoisospora suis TaxID=483139 RepID=A0A2C6LCP5_9APIC|nr:helicase conserved c-terminal domain-containing [Cystoisospora suis]
MGELLSGIVAGKGSSWRMKESRTERYWRELSLCGVHGSPRISRVRVTLVCWSSPVIKTASYNPSSFFRSSRTVLRPRVSPVGCPFCTAASSVSPFPARRPSTLRSSRLSPVPSEVPATHYPYAGSKQYPPFRLSAPYLGTGSPPSLSAQIRPTRVSSQYCPLTVTVVSSFSSRQPSPTLLSPCCLFLSSSWSGCTRYSTDISSPPSGSPLSTSVPTSSASPQSSSTSSVCESSPSLPASPTLLPRPAVLSGILHPRLQPSYLSSLSPLAAKWLRFLSPVLEHLPPPSLRLWGGSSCELKPQLLPPPLPLLPLLQPACTSPLQSLLSSLLSFRAQSDSSLASSSSLPPFLANSEALLTNLLSCFPSDTITSKAQDPRKPSLVPWNLSYSLQNSLKISHLLPLQQALLPFLLSSAYDLHVISRSGTGKSIAVHIAVSLRLFDEVAISASMSPVNNKDETFPFCIFLVPTRDLAVQTAEQLNKLLGYSPFRVALLTGGRSFIDASHHARHERECSMYHGSRKTGEDEFCASSTSPSSRDFHAEDGGLLQCLFQLGEKIEMGKVSEKNSPGQCSEATNHEELIRRTSTWKGPGGREERSWRAFDWLEKQKAHIWVCTPGRLEEYLAFHEWREFQEENRRHSVRREGEDDHDLGRTEAEPRQKEDAQKRSLGERAQPLHEEASSGEKESSSLPPTSPIDVLRDCRLLIVEEAAITLQDEPGQRSLTTLLRLKEQLSPDHQTVFLSTSISPDLRAMVSRLCRVRNLTINALSSPSLSSLSSSCDDQSPLFSSASSNENSSYCQGELTPPSSTVVGTQPTPDTSTTSSHVADSSSFVSSHSTPSSCQRSTLQFSEELSAAGISGDFSEKEREKPDTARDVLETLGPSSSILSTCAPLLVEEQNRRAVAGLAERGDVETEDKVPPGATVKTRLKEISSAPFPCFQEDILSVPDGVGLWGPKRAGDFLKKKRRQFLEEKRLCQAVQAQSDGDQSYVTTFAHEDKLTSKACGREQTALLSGSWGAGTTKRGLSLPPECIQSEFAMYPAELHAHVVLNAMLSEIRRATLVHRWTRNERKGMNKPNSHEQDERQYEARVYRGAEGYEEKQTFKEREGQEEKSAHLNRTPQSTVVRGILFFSCLKTLQFHYVFFKHFFFSSLRSTRRLTSRTASSLSPASSSSSFRKPSSSVSSSSSEPCISSPCSTSVSSSPAAADDYPLSPPPIPHCLPYFYALHHGLTPERRRAAVHAFAEKRSGPRLSAASPPLHDPLLSPCIVGDEDLFLGSAPEGTTSAFSTTVRGKNLEREEGQDKNINDKEQDVEADVRILFATDIASAGLDLGTVDFIIHVGIPRDVDHFVQRLTRITRPPPPRALFPLLAQALSSCSADAPSNEFTRIPTSSLTSAGARMVAQRQDSCSLFDTHSAKTELQEKEDKRSFSENEFLVGMPCISNTPVMKENYTWHSHHAHTPGRSLLLLHDLDSHFLFQAYDANVSLKEISPRNALEILQPHPTLSALLPARFFERLRASVEESAWDVGKVSNENEKQAEEEEKRGRRRKGKKRVEQNGTCKDVRNNCKSVVAGTDQKQRKIVDDATAEREKKPDETCERTVTTEKDLLFTSISSEHNQTSSSSASRSSPSLLDSERHGLPAETDDHSLHLRREGDEAPFAPTLSFPSSLEYLFGKAGSVKGIEEIPILFASCELMYRNLLGFYAMQANKLKFERWQVPSLVNALLSSFGVSTPPSVTKQFAARLRILNAPGLTVDYWATPKTELLANLAAYPGFQSRMREIALTGGIRNSPVLRLRASERKQMFVSELEKRKAETAGSINGRCSGPPSVPPSRELMRKDQRLPMGKNNEREEEEEQTNHDEARKGLVRGAAGLETVREVQCEEELTRSLVGNEEHDSSTTCTREELCQFSIVEDTPAEEKIERESKSPTKTPLQDDVHMDDVVDEHKDDIVWLSLYPPPVPLHLVPGGREMQREQAAQKEIEREKKRRQKDTVVHIITSGKSRTP